MSKLIFEASIDAIYDASVYTLGPNQIRIIFDSDEAIPGNDVIYSGFIIVNEYNHVKEADYTDYIYKYRDVEDRSVFDLDNDNIPYTPEPEPEPPIPPEPPVPEPSTLAEILEQKIQELSLACHNEIEYGIDLMIDGNIEHFSYSLSGGDQNNIDDLFNTMNLTLAPQYYHADGKSCKLYTPAQIFYIYFNNKAQTQDAITYYNQLVMWLKDIDGDAEDTEANRNAVESVTWRITELIDKYLELYESVLEQGQTQLEAYKMNLESRGVEFPDDIYQDAKVPEDIVLSNNDVVPQQEETVSFDDIIDSAVDDKVEEIDESEDEEVEDTDSENKEEEIEETENEEVEDTESEE